MGAEQVDSEHAEDFNTWLSHMKDNDIDPLDRVVSLVEAGMPSKRAIDHVAKSPPLTTHREGLRYYVKSSLLKMTAEDVYETFVDYSKGMAELIAKAARKKNTENESTETGYTDTKNTEQKRV